MRNLLSKLGLTGQAAKRISKPRQGWGSQTELLEERALLSAASCDMPESAVVAHVAHGKKAMPVVYPNIGGNWNIQVSGEFQGTGSVAITQSGKKHNQIDTLITIQGLGTFGTHGTLSKKTPFEISGKTPKLDLPGFPIKVSLTVTISFPPGNLNPTTFSGTAKAPFVGNVATLSATKV